MFMTWGPLIFPLKVTGLNVTIINFLLEVTDLKVTVRYKNSVKSNAFKVKRYFQSVTSNDPLLFAHLWKKPTSKISWDCPFKAELIRNSQFGQHILNG